MILILLFSIISFITIISILRSDKPLKHILSEVKYELIYQYIGAKALLEDLIHKNKNVTDLPNKTGQFAIVTGGSRGIGTEVVKMLLKCNMHVIIGCRDVSAGEKLEVSIRKEGIKTGEIRCYKLDTSSIKSVKEFARKIKEKYTKIHILVNNAGIMFGPYVLTEDGFESQLAINHLGHFLLSHLLLPQLKAAGTEISNSRIVNVSSIAHIAGGINFEDIHFKSQYVASQAYSQSKLAQILSTIYLQKVFKENKIPVEIFSVHPGLVNTDLFNGTHIKKIFPWLPELIFKNTVQGATPIIYTSVSEELEGRGGAYISNCKISSVSKEAQSIENQEKLFKVTKELLQIKEFGAE